MSSRTAPIIVDASLASAYNSAPKTKQKKALSAMRSVLRESRPAQPTVPRLSKRETRLFLRINRHLTLEKQQRYDELKQKREDETLTKAEHKELLQFVEEIEDIWADRLRAVIELAKLRGISPRELMKQLEIEPRSYDD
jgi:hypothetical protein